jgi:hypothetical protein
VEALTVLRYRGSHIFQTISLQMVVSSEALRAGRTLLEETFPSVVGAHLRWRLSKPIISGISRHKQNVHVTGQPAFSVSTSRFIPL